jgi:amidohydrolase
MAQALSIPQPLGARVDQIAAEIQPRVVATRRDLHQHPELGFQEKRTSDLIAARLRELKFDAVRTGIAGTGVLGVLKGGKPGKVVAVRADMDALPIQETIDVPYRSQVPGVKHACGHDGHVSIALGAAELLSRIRDQIPGTVEFIFQPAEEGDPDGGETGALRLVKAGVLADPAPAAIFGLHVMPTIPVGQIGFNVGATMASSDQFKITIMGRRTHGAYPHTGIDPIPIAALVVMALQTIPSREIDAEQPTVVTVGVIKGGNRFNIIADSVEMEGTVRSLSKDGPATVKTKMEAILKGMTSSYGAAYTLDYRFVDPVTWNDPALVAASLAALEAVVGTSNLVSPPPQMGAEDFSYYQQKIPGFFYFLGVRNEAKHATSMIHTEDFDLDEDALQIGVRAMSHLVLDYLYRK